MTKLSSWLGPVTAVALRIGIVAGSMLLLGLLLDYIGFPTRKMFFIVFSAFVLSAAISPAVNALERRGVPRPASIGLIYLAVASLFGSVIYTLIPVVAQEVNLLTTQVPQILSKLTALATRFNLPIHLDSLKESLAPHLEQGLTAAGSSLQHIVASGFNTTLSIFLVLITSFFITARRDFLVHAIAFLVPKNRRPKAEKVVRQIFHEIGRWARAQLMLALMFGVLFGTGLTILGLQFAVTIGFVGAVLEFIPFGGVLSITLAIVIALTEWSNPLWPLVAIGGMYLVIMELKDHVVAPKLMESFLGIEAGVIILSVVGLAETFGVMGALLAVPMVICGKVMLIEWLASLEAAEPVRYYNILGADGLPLRIEAPKSAEVIDFAAHSKRRRPRSVTRWLWERSKDKSKAA